jgi:hypothetical protein
MFELGFCPVCHSPGETRERRPDGYDTCEKGHKYLSRLSVSATVVDEIVTYKTLYDDQLHSYIVEGVRFRKDFGPWKKDEFVAVLCFNFLERTIVEYESDSDNIIKQAKIHLTVE